MTDSDNNDHTRVTALSFKESYATPFTIEPPSNVFVLPSITETVFEYQLRKFTASNE
jgi:hypothetical protein